jgi:hypothetical protein
MNRLIFCPRYTTYLTLFKTPVLGLLALIFAMISSLASASVFEKKCAELLDPTLAALRSNSRVQGNFWRTPWGNEIRFEFKLQKGGSGSLIIDEANKNMDLHCKFEKTVAADAQSTIGAWYQESFGESPKIKLEEADGFVTLSFNGLHRFSAVQTKKFVERILEIFGQDTQPSTPPPAKVTTAPQDSKYFNALIQKFPRFAILAALQGFDWGQMLTPWGKFFQATSTIDDRKVTLSVEEANGETSVTIESLNGAPLAQITVGSLTSTGDAKRQRLEGAQALSDEQILGLLR